MDYRNPMYYETPIDQKMDQVHRKLARLHADHETLAAENRQLHQRTFTELVIDLFFVYSTIPNNSTLLF